MLDPEHRDVGVVVELEEIRPPAEHHRESAAEHDADHRLQAARPRLERAEAGSSTSRASRSGAPTSPRSSRRSDWSAMQDEPIRARHPPFSSNLGLVRAPSSRRWRATSAARAVAADLSRVARLPTAAAVPGIGQDVHARAPAEIRLGAARRRCRCCTMRRWRRRGRTGRSSLDRSAGRRRRCPQTCWAPVQVQREVDAALAGGARGAAGAAVGDVAREVGAPIAAQRAAARAGAGPAGADAARRAGVAAAAAIRRVVQGIDAPAVAGAAVRVAHAGAVDTPLADAAGVSAGAAVGAVVAELDALGSADRQAVVAGRRAVPAAADLVGGAGASALPAVVVIDPEIDARAVAEDGARGAPARARDAQLRSRRTRGRRCRSCSDPPAGPRRRRCRR